MRRENLQQLISDLEKKRESFYKSLNGNRGYRLDREFARPDDEPLTKEEIAEIDAYWGKYKFAYPEIDYESFKIFKNRCGYFDVRHCPGNVEYQFFFKNWEASKWAIPFQNKAMLPILYSNVKQPRTIVRRMRDVLYNEHYEPIPLDEAVKIILEHMAGDNATGVIVKPNMKNGGHGIEFVTQDNSDEQGVREILKKMGGRDFVAQEMMRQSEFTKQFNPSSVNTLRITTLFFERTVHVLGGILRIGKSGNRVDNFCSGGSLLGFDIETGKCNNWAQTSGNVRITTLPFGIDLERSCFTVPNLEEVKKAVKSMHYRMPYVRMIAWDIALDENNVPNLIECNFCGYYQINEAVKGPLFAPLLDKMLDHWLKKFFSIDFATEEFLCKEYHDHIEIVEYIGSSGEVKIPEMLREKPVKKILAKAFKNCTISDFSAPMEVIRNSPDAMKSIPEFQL